MTHTSNMYSLITKFARMNDNNMFFFSEYKVIISLTFIYNYFKLHNLKT